MILQFYWEVQGHVEMDGSQAANQAVAESAAGAGAGLQIQHPVAAFSRFDRRLVEAAIESSAQIVQQSTLARQRHLPSPFPASSPRRELLSVVIGARWCEN